MIHPIRFASFFILGSMLCTAVAVAQLKEPPKGAVATVNGKTVPLAKYEELVSDYLSFQRRDGGRLELDPMVDDGIFLELIDATLVEQEAAKRKITVTRDAAVKAMLADPPQFIKDQFTDNKGTFHAETFRQVVRKPELIVSIVGAGANSAAVVAQWKKDLEKVVRYVQQRELKKKLSDALFAEKPITDGDIKARYFAEQTTVNGSFVRVLHSTIPDSLAPVSVEEARAWYEGHKEDYRFAAARSIGATILQVTPLPADTARQQREIDSIRTILTALPIDARAARVDALLRTLPPNRFPPGTTVSITQMPAEMRDAMAKASSGDIVGPIYRQNEAILLHVESVIPTRDTVLRARHVLLRVNANVSQSDSDAFNLGTVLKESILQRPKAEQDSVFREAARFYSQDASSAVGGDLGYFGHGQMIDALDSAAYNSAIGEIVGPIRSRFGYHLLMVTDRLAKEYVIRELRFPLTASQPARQAVMEDALRLANALYGRGSVDSVLADLRQRYPKMISDTSTLERLQIYGDALVTGEFAFRADVGDVATLELPLDRIAVVKVLAERPGGIPPFEKFPNYVTAHARRAKQMEMLKPRIAKLADSLQPEMLLGPMREIAPLAEIFLINSQPVPTPPDEKETLLDSLVMVTPTNSVSGPVRGTHGYYFLRVLDRTGPGEADYQRERASFRAAYMERYRQKLLKDLVARARTMAEIEDYRPNIRAALRGL